MDATELREAMRTSVMVPSSIVESVLAEQAAEIERLREDRNWMGFIESEVATIRADERRRTAEEIARLLGIMWQEIEPSTSYREGLRDGLVRAQGRIAREVGGSE